MKLHGLAFVLLVAPLFLANCSRIVQVTLFNNTGEAIEVRAGSEHETIAPDQFAKFKYPGEDANRVFRISGGRCEYLYQLSSEFGYDESHYDPAVRSDRGIQIQVEKDFSVNLLPDSYTGSAPAPSEMVLQQRGFPMRPVSKTCR